MRATITLTITGPDVDRDKLRTIADAAEVGFKVDGWAVEECHFEADQPARPPADVKPGDRVRILGDSGRTDHAFRAGDLGTALHVATVEQSVKFGYPCQVAAVRGDELPEHTHFDTWDVALVDLERVE